MNSLRIFLLALSFLSSPLLQAQSADSTAIPEKEILTFVEQMPEFKGDMYSFLSKNIQYPADAKLNKIEGRVILSFVVNEDGTIDQQSIKSMGKPIGFGLEEEAIRVVSLMKDWIPGKQNGHPVNVRFTLPISFRLKN